MGVVAFLSLPLTGWFWVNSLRSAIRKVWALPEYPGTFFFRLFIDLLVLIGLGVLFSASLATAFTTTALADRLVDLAELGIAPTRWLPAMIGPAAGLAVYVLLSTAVLTGLPRLRMTPRRVLPAALHVAVALELLKTVGSLYIRRTEANPTYQVVAGTVGLLVFLNVVNQLIVFAAALTATSTTGTVTDLAARPWSPESPADHERDLAPPAIGPACSGQP